MNFRRISSYRVSSDLSLMEKSFDPSAYSKFKYGNHHNTELFAGNIHRLMLEKLQSLRHEEFLITSSAYKEVPTASESLVVRLFDWIRDTFPKARKVKIHRENVFSEDYATLTSSEREHLTRSVRLSVDPDVVKGRKIVVIDDAYVSGAHERNMVRLLKDLASEVIFIYIVEIYGHDTSRAESLLNYAAVKNVFHLTPFIQAGDFHLNARVCKFLLTYPNTEELVLFLSRQSEPFLIHLYESVIRDGYDRMEPLKTNFELIKNAATLKWQLEEA